MASQLARRIRIVMLMVPVWLSPVSGSYSASVRVLGLVCGLFWYALATRRGGLLTAGRWSG